jgi:hypothetical protein
MSVLDQLRAIEQQVEKRLRELAPLVAEYRDLEKVAERLGLRRDERESAETAAAKPPAAPKPKAKAKAKPSRSKTRTTAAAKPRAKRAAKPSASTSAPADASTDATSQPRRSAAASKPKPKAKATGGGKPTSRSRRNAAAPGQREHDVLRLVSERPGITVAELAQELSVDATGLYGVVRRLQTKGQITKDGTALHPITEAASTPPTAAATPPEPAATSTTAESPASPPEPPEPPATGS